ncbi:MAG: ATP-binding cassette domain-containing protein, partial [Ktedonobacteraceae bacterium]|nr:ATP-binding cassette domain-containing protein [Ktedonobacteraceae bacterium]
ESGGIRIDALHVTKRGNQQVILLNDLSFAIPPRKFVALVGGSGAGKSTLMDALNGQRPAQQGTILYNGQDYYKHLAAFSAQLGYVPQDDIIHRELTVERALYYAAKLRLPDDFTREQIKQRIEEVLEDVEMKRQRHLLVNKLSGGQRKRVSIALELLANPNVFFLDEPTSGLDPGLDRKMMMLMRKLADRGRTIILVTHATNNINACDYVCFLARGGQLAYFGPPNEAKEYFGKTDFAEIYSSLEPTDDNPNVPAEAGARFRQSQEFQRYVLEPISQGQSNQNAQMQATAAAVKPPKRGNPWKQFRILSSRYLELLKNDSVNLAILLLQAPVIAVLLLFMLQPNFFITTSIVACPAHPELPFPAAKENTLDCQRYIDALNTSQGEQFVASKGLTKQEALDSLTRVGSGADAQKILFIMSFAAVLFGCINGSREIVKEAAIYKRERAVNLGILPYMFSKFIVLGTLCLLQSLILVAVVMWRSPITTSVFLPPFAEIYITMALTSLAGLMVGLTISAIVPNNDRAMSLVPLALLPQVLFAGVVISLDNPAALQYIGAFFPTRWAMAAMGTSIGLHGKMLATDTFSYQGTLFSFNTQAQATTHLLVCWLALAIMIVVLGAFIGWCIKRKDVRV